MYVFNSCDLGLSQYCNVFGDRSAIQLFLILHTSSSSILVHTFIAALFFWAMSATAAFRAYSVAYYFSKMCGTMPFRIDKTRVSASNVRAARSFHREREMINLKISLVFHQKESQWCLKGVTFSLFYIGLAVLSVITTIKHVSNMTKFNGTRVVSRLTK